MSSEGGSGAGISACRVGPVEGVTAATTTAELLKPGFEIAAVVLFVLQECLEERTVGVVVDHGAEACGFGVVVHQLLLEIGIVLEQTEQIRRVSHRLQLGGGWCRLRTPTYRPAAAARRPRARRRRAP